MKTQNQSGRGPPSPGFKWFFILDQQGSNNEDVVTSSKLTAAIVENSCLFIWFQRQMDNF